MVERSKLGAWRDGHVIDGKLHQWKRTVCLLEKDQGRNRIFPHVFDVLFKKNFVVLMLNRGLDPRPILSDFRIFCGANLVLTRSFRRVRFFVAMLQAISSNVDI